MLDEQRYARASDLLRQLQGDLDAIATAPDDSVDRSRAVTSYSATYAELGRLMARAGESPRVVIIRV